jgi:hypothetical protein
MEKRKRIENEYILDIVETKKKKKVLLTRCALKYLPSNT